MFVNAFHVIGAIVIAMWIAWVFYWWYAAHNAKTAQRQESTLSRAAHTLPLAFAGWLLGAQHVPIEALNEPIFEPHLTLEAIGAVLTALGLAFAVRARNYLGPNWSAAVTIKQDHSLVRTGPYRYVRHPIYTGLLLAVLGSAMVRNEWRGVLSLAIAAAALWRKLRLEERWLVETFGEAYQSYREEVRALIPFVV
ncbi:MAG TPA: isoprenylcysteine carboxylmethyltransferase family protein [Casimicrobiaceae bacterium]|nr:isoprenylcysteine carboxylmethyltransferase family protein [Casimicrobiaceae bacterium]